MTAPLQMLSTERIKTNKGPRSRRAPYTMQQAPYTIHYVYYSFFNINIFYSKLNKETMSGFYRNPCWFEWGRKEVIDIKTPITNCIMEMWSCDPSSICRLGWTREKHCNLYSNTRQNTPLLPSVVPPSNTKNVIITTMSLFFRKYLLHTTVRRSEVTRWDMRVWWIIRSDHSLSSV